MKNTKFFLFFLLLFGSAAGYAQTDSAQWKKDSVNNVQLNRQILSVQQFSDIRLADSLKRVNLQKQMALLNAGDKTQRLTLLKELNGLKERDSLQLTRQKQQVDSLRRFVKGYPVAPFRDTLFEKNVVAILTWGGLRGGLSVALALSLSAAMHKDQFVLITYMVVVFSILVQGLTIGRVTKKLLRSA